MQKSLFFWSYHTLKMGVIRSSETFVTMYQSTNRQGPHILSQCIADNVGVLLYLKTVLVVVFSPNANKLWCRQAAHCMWKFILMEL